MESLPNAMSHRAVDDAQFAGWMKAACAGDGAAERQLLQALAPRLRAFFRSRGLANDQAEDLVQDTLLAVHLRRGLYDQSQPLLPWVGAIARYRLIDRWRREGRRGVAVSVDDVADTLAAEDVEPGDPSRDLARLMQDLPEKQRRSLELIKLQEHSVAQAAQMTGWSESDIKVSAHRGLKALMRLAADWVR
jgi:RNA polymerase sigma-70 factor, ECF subfamily